MSIRYIYDKNYRPVFLSTTGILFWNLGPDPFFFGNKQQVAWQKREQVWKELTGALEK